ncbi:MAG: ATP synthase F1 subunit delta [Bacteroidia bacterium]|nr:ATP synthase F1 subunit delta [Bacteroidia bacterium]
MSDASVAFRYAKPILELAIEQGIVDNINDDMQLLKTTADNNRDFFVVLKNPVIRGDKKLSILKALFEDKMHKLTLLLFEIMTRKNRENILYEVSKQFTRQYNEYKGIQHVTLTSAISLPDALKESLKQKLAQQLDKTIILNEKVNPQLIGGFVVQVDNSQIDNSIRSQLLRIKRNFTEDTSF